MRFVVNGEYCGLFLSTAPEFACRDWWS